MRIYHPTIFLAPLPQVSAFLCSATSDFRDKESGGPGSSYEGEGGSSAPGKSTLVEQRYGTATGSPLVKTPAAYLAGSPPTRPAAADPDGGANTQGPVPLGGLPDEMFQHVAAGAPGTGPATAATAAPNKYLMAPDEVDFSEVPVGKHPRQPVHVWNAHPQGAASVSARLDGSGDLSLMHPIPDRLEPSHRAGSGTPFRIIYQPTKSGKAQATLTVSATWQEFTGWPPSTVEIPIRGAAYIYGEDTPSVVEAKRLREEAHRREVADKKARAEEQVEAVKKNKEIEAPYPQNHEDDLESAGARTLNAIIVLQEKQAIGIRTASAEADAFKRKITSPSPSLLRQLAMQAFHMWFYGMSGQIAQVAKLVTKQAQSIRSDSKKGDSDKTTALEAMVGDMVKGGVRKAGAAAEEAIFGGKDDAEKEDADGPRIAFFTEQEDELSDLMERRLEMLRIKMNVLKPKLRNKKQAGEAVDEMNAAADVLEKLKEAARELQADASRFAWMRFLAQTELGSLTPGEMKQKGLEAGADGAPAIRLGTALNLPAEHEPLPRYDGILDLEISIDTNSPTGSRRITNARMNGIIPATARSLSGMPLSELLQKGVVIRVHLKDPKLAVVKAVAVFDGDRVEVRDETAALPQDSNLFSRMGGHIGRPSPWSQDDGARVLREWLEDQALGELGLQVETDHVPRAR